MFNWLFGKKNYLNKGDVNMSVISFKYALGLKARDIVTGCEGIIVVRNHHLFGCSQYGIAQEKLENGTIPSTEYFDEGRLEIIGDGIYDRVEDPKSHFADIFIHEAGLEAKDKVTGFKGKIVVRGEYLNSANQYALFPNTDENGKLQEPYFFDEGRLTILGEGIHPKEVESPKRGPVFNRDTQKGLY